MDLKDTIQQLGKYEESFKTF